MLSSSAQENVSTCFCRLWNNPVQTNLHEKKMEGDQFLKKKLRGDYGRKSVPITEVFKSFLFTSWPVWEGETPCPLCIDASWLVVGVFLFFFVFSVHFFLILTLLSFLINLILYICHNKMGLKPFLLVSSDLTRTRSSCGKLQPATFQDNIRGWIKWRVSLRVNFQCGRGLSDSQ